MADSAPPRDQLGKRLRALRALLGLTQEELAERSDLRRIDVVKVENGHNKASSHGMRVKLAKGLGLSLEDTDGLLDGTISIETARRRSDVKRKAG